MVRCLATPAANSVEHRVWEWPLKMRKEVGEALLVLRSGQGLTACRPQGTSSWHLLAARHLPDCEHCCCFAASSCLCRLVGWYTHHRLGMGEPLRNHCYVCGLLLAC